MSAPEHQIIFKVSAGLHDAILAELGHCGCSLNSFLHVAIAKEIQYRRHDRRAARAAFEALNPEQGVEK